MEETTVQESSVLKDIYQPINPDQPSLPTWSLLIVLVITFFILKSFIYIKDGDRHGK